jgi:hypothetical protein
MLPLFREGVTLEITPVIALPVIGNKSFSTLKKEKERENRK